MLALQPYIYCCPARACPSQPSQSPGTLNSVHLHPNSVLLHPNALELNAIHLLQALLVKHYWLSSDGHYGYHNIHLGHVEAGIKYGCDRTLKLMRLTQICAQRDYKRPKGYYSVRPDITASNMLDHAFNVPIPNQY